MTNDDDQSRNAPTIQVEAFRKNRLTRVAGRYRAPGPVDRPFLARTQTRLCGFPTCHGREKPKVKPEFSTLNRPAFTSCKPRAATRGEPSRRENVLIENRDRHPLRRLPRLPVNSPPRNDCSRRGDGRGSPSCTGVGVVKLGRGGPAVRGVTPEADQYPSLAAGFRRRALFFEKPPHANQSADRLLRSFRIRRLDSG